MTSLFLKLSTLQQAMIPLMTLSQYFCADCNAPTNLNLHGLCERCGSQAVTLETGTNPEYWRKKASTK